MRKNVTALKEEGPQSPWTWAWNWFQFLRDIESWVGAFFYYVRARTEGVTLYFVFEAKMWKEGIFLIW